MFKPTKATTVKGYLDSIPEERKEAILFLHTFIQKSVPQLKPYFANNMLGYGKFKYLNYRKEIIDWPIIALANQKLYISLYLCSVIDGHYVAEMYKEKLGKVTVGKSCIRFKKWEDIHLPTLDQLLKMAAQHPGLTRETKT